MSEQNKIEQQNELEALQSIYPTELTLLSDTQFKIEIFPYTVESDDEPNTVGVTMEVSYPTEYPESSIPDVILTNTKGNIPNRQMMELKELITETAQQFLGTSCVFSLASTVQEWLIQWQLDCNSSAASEKQDENLDRFTMDNEVLQSNIGKGTPVTIENFREWRDKFVVEQKKLMEKQRLERLKKFPGLKTGREIFEERQQALINKIGEAAAMQYVEEDEIEDVEGEIEEENGEEIDEDLFLEDDDEEEEQE